MIVCVVCLPLKHIILTSSYGYRIHPVTGKFVFHAGIDLRARSDTVFAVLPGRVVSTGFNNFLGVFVRLNHGDFQSTYGHLSQIFVLPGDSVATASPLGITGMTGRVTGEHLHFSIQFKQQYIDPLMFFRVILH